MRETSSFKLSVRTRRFLGEAHRQTISLKEIQVKYIPANNNKVPTQGCTGGAQQNPYET